MPKLPGAKLHLPKVTGFIPLVAYVLTAAVLVWTAVTVYTGALRPLQNPTPLDPTLVLQRQEQVKDSDFESASAHFPAHARTISPAPNPFAR